MLPRFHWSDITTVGHYLGVLILLTGAIMLVPAAVALAFGEYAQLAAFVEGMGACALLGSALRLLKHRELDRRRSLLLVGFAWIVIGFVASIPLHLSGSFDSWLDALFESVSSLTSTGVTVARDVDCMSYAQITWHVVMSFVGALAVITIALYTGFFGEGSKLHLHRNLQDGKRTPSRIGETWVLVLRVLGGMALAGTVAAGIVCLLLGLGPVDALMNGLWLSFGAIGTGSFVPHSTGLLYYHSLPLELILCVLMLAGALSFGVYAYIRRQDYKQIARNSELRAYLAWLIVLVAFVTGIMTREELFTTLGGIIQNGFVTIVSAATTCGMQAVYPQQLGGAISEGVVIWIIVAFLFGACAYSTGGGIKAIRILQVLHWIKYSIMLRIAPDSAHIRVKYEQFGTRDLSARDATQAMTICILYLATAALGSMAFIAYGNNALDSVFEAVSYVTNCGMTTSITQMGLPAGLKVVSLLLMWVGRVEFIALIAAVIGLLLSLHPGNLFSNGRSRNLRTQKDRNRGGTAWRKRKGQGPKGQALGALAGIAMAALLLMQAVNPANIAMAATSGGAEVSVEEIVELEILDTYRNVEIKDLLAATQRQDNRDVMLEGQAMGASLVADQGHSWVNVKKDGSMIGVYMTNAQASTIEDYGAYERTGDTIVIRGAYHLACPQHQGQLDVHAEGIEVVEQGACWKSDVHVASFAWGGFMLVVGGMLAIVRRKIYDKPHRVFALR